MRCPTTTALLLLPAAIAAVSLDCKHIRIGERSFDLSSLTGPKEVHWTRHQAPNIANTTFTLDLCQSLTKPASTPTDDFCRMGTRVCGVQRLYRPEQEPYVWEVIPIAGQFALNGRHLDPKVTRLKGGASNSDAEREGVVIELHGGVYEGVKQQANVELRCDKAWTGREGFEGEEEKRAAAESLAYGSMARRADDEDSGDDEGDGDGDGEEDPEPDLPDLDAGKALTFVSYKKEDDIMVLRLTWKTKHACEDALDDADPEDDSPPKDDGGDGKKKKAAASWGFFTWFLIVVFLLAASYIIFGSWLNYNRYGARGWDLIPHSDAIRDFPYVVKDWVAGLGDRMRGGGGGGSGSRQGYSAV